MAVSPTKRTLDHCRKSGVETIQVVEVWNAFTKTRKDLFGFIDVLAVVPGAGVLGIQATSSTNVAARLRKSKDEDHIRHLHNWLSAGCGFEVWGWGKNTKGRVTLRRVPVTLEDLELEQT